MRFIKALGIWFFSFIALILAADLIFPTNDEGQTEVSAVYLLITFILPIVFAVFFCRSKTNSADSSTRLPLSKKKREDMATDLLASARVSANIASDAVCVSTFVEEWDEMIGALTKLTAFEGKISFKHGSPTADVYKLNSEFQWKLRDAIERAKEHTLSEIRGKYRNSQEHKEMQCRWFEQDINSVSHRFSDETAHFADVAIGEIRSSIGIAQAPSIPLYAERSEEFTKYGGIDAELLTIDLMDGHTFEYWCADLLCKLGFINVEVTPGSGDQGVDILAEKEGIKYAIQCKCYASDLGNTPIQEVHAGKAMYHCQVGAVMTNRYFTLGGRQLAEATGTLLWDRDWIQNALVATSKA